MTWDELASVAADELRLARFTFRDDIALQRKLRLESLERAQHQITQAIAALEMPKREEVADSVEDEDEDEDSELCHGCRMPLMVCQC